MNFHSPIVAAAVQKMSRSKAATKAPLKVERAEGPVVIARDPKGRTDQDWLRFEKRDQSVYGERLRAFDAFTGNAQSGASERLMRKLREHFERMREAGRAVDVEDDLGETGTVSDEPNNREIAALLDLLRHPCATTQETQVLGRYLDLLGDQYDWKLIDGAAQALVDGMMAKRPKHPDAGLIALKLTFDECRAEDVRLEKANDAATTENQHDLGRALDAAYAKTTKVAKRIAGTRAYTLDGLFIKTAIWEWCRPEDKSSPRYDIDDEGNSTTDMKVLASLMKDLGRLAGPPPSYPEDHPWVTVRRLSTELSAALARINDGPVMALIKPATEPSAIAWGDLDVFGSMLPLKPVEIEDMGDKLQGDIDALRELVRTIAWDLANLCHAHPEKPGERHTELDQVGRLVRVLETVADKLVIDVDEHVTHLYGVAGANRTNFDDVQKALREPPASAVNVGEDRAPVVGKAA